MRKTLSLLLALCMALSLAPAALTTPVSAAVDERSVRFLGAEISNGKINVNVTAGSTVSEAQLVVAAYRKSGQLTGYSSIPIDLSTDSGLFRLDLPENGDFYKVFLLDGSSHPLCAAAEATDIEDYVRAFEQGYVSKSCANADRTAQIRSTTYRAMLVQMIEDLAPEKIHYFDRKVTTFDTPLTRGMAAMMSWYNNVRISYNFCEMPYVYAEMTAVEGENIDFNNHSMFKPEYPVIIYAAQNYLIPASPITIDGCLPAGTQLDLYLARTEGDGTFTISSEDGILWEEALSVHNYTTSYQLSGYYPYATSDKKISITLQKDTDQLSLACSGGRLEWSGMDVTLPDSYAVERWYSYSGYDAWLDGDESLAGMSLRTTSRVMLCPNSNTGHHITIHEDITYSSESIAALSTKETIEAWGQAIRAFTPEALIRFENPYFNAGTTEASAERYYEDMLSMFDKYDFDWYSNDYGFVLNNLYAGSKLVRYRDDYVNLKLLQLLQKHR